jgi:predicted metal-dependent HD superfamily phosphohydrolase
MQTIRDISIDKLNYLINKYVLPKYLEPHRHYHNLNHIQKMLSLVSGKFMTSFKEYTKLYLAIVFHDAIYNVGSNTNEEESANFFLNFFDTSDDDGYDVYNTILSTKNHLACNHISKILIELDLYDLLHPDKKVFEFNTINLYKESGMENFDEFKEANKKFLYSYIDKIGEDNYKILSTWLKDM